MIASKAPYASFTCGGEADRSSGAKCSSFFLLSGICSKEVKTAQTNMVAQVVRAMNFKSVLDLTSEAVWRPYWPQNLIFSVGPKLMEVFNLLTTNKFLSLQLMEVLSLLTMIRL